MQKQNEHNRIRNITVGFRVSEEENRQINEMVSVSGLPKQEYCYRRCMNRELTVLPNPRVFKGLKTVMNDMIFELKRIADASELTCENLESLALILTALTGLKGDTNGE